MEPVGRRAFLAAMTLGGLEAAPTPRESIGLPPVFWHFVRIYFDANVAPRIQSQHRPTIPAKSRSTWEIVRRVAIYLKPYKLMAFGTICLRCFRWFFNFLSEAHPHRDR